MKVIAKRAEMAALARRWAKDGQSIGFVPTMGALHEGHASLIRRARRENRRVIVSVFVNPAQFGPGEDYSIYPRTFPADKALCQDCGADAVYRPDVEQMYPPGFSTVVKVSGLSDIHCGRFRRGHFRAVTTIVLKLLETTRPARAYFGEKDYQQLAIIRLMARDLDLDVAVVGCPTAREPDGLALSSRNRFLSPEDRQAAPRLFEALVFGRELARAGDIGPGRLLSRVCKRIHEGLPGAMIDYVSLVDPQYLKPASEVRGQLRLLAAVRLGKTRLIDNLPISC